jgi:hypothetical protein
MMVRVFGGGVYLGEKVVREKEYLSAIVDYVCLALRTATVKE